VALTLRRALFILAFATAYVAIGQFVHLIRNPMVPGAIIAVNMVVVVIAGIILGPEAGAAVGLLGTAANAFLTPAGNPFERAAIVPHMVMGAAAGIAGRRSTFSGALAIMVGHALNVAVFVISRLLPASTMRGALFFSGLLFEIVVDVVVILFAVPLLRSAGLPAPADPAPR
jgi:uncharacterized membrane protein